MDTGELRVFGPDLIKAGLAHLGQADVLIAHNGIRYDIPVLKKLYGFCAKGSVLDTVVIARLIHPNIKDTDAALIRAGKMPSSGYLGKHTIGAWGYRLGKPKLHEDITDWSQWTQEIQDRCAGDVETNLLLWKHLDPDNYSQEAISLEHRIAYVCDQMEQCGVPFDVKAAGELHATLIGRKAEIEQKLIDQFGSWWAPISPDPEKCVLIPKKDNARLGYVVGYPIKKYKKVTFNPGSRDHIAKVLKDRGWEPKEFTAGGKPEINEDTVASIVAQFPEMRGLGEFLMLEKRLSQLSEGKQAWLTAVKEDGRIHGAINPMGTTTSRGAHFAPNLGQVPALKKPFGKECRALFHVPNGWVLVGADQEGLELRGLAHYLALKDEGRYAQVVCKGDPHWHHAQAMGLVGGERNKDDPLHKIIREDGAKRFIYAYIYGCWDDKAGEIIFRCLLNGARQCGEAGKKLFLKFFKNTNPGEKALRSVGRKVRAEFAQRIVGYQELQERISQQVKARGWVPGLDGRRVPVRSAHSALNFLIQSAGAIICKRWVCDAFDELNSKYKHGWDGDFVFCLWVHDEVQVACREGMEKEVGDCLVRHARSAGEPYKFRVPLDSSYSTGSNWAETH